MQSLARIITVKVILLGKNHFRLILKKRRLKMPIQLARLRHLSKSKCKKGTLTVINFQTKLLSTNSLLRLLAILKKNTKTSKTSTVWVLLKLSIMTPILKRTLIN